MASAIDQKAYLQKYLGGPKGDKKKKKKKAPKGNGLKIIDDDLDLSKLRPLDGDELDILDEGEDGPQVAGIIDERPEEVRKLEQFKTSSKWRVVTQDDGFNSKLQIEEIKKDVKEIEKENELVFGKMYSDSEDEVEKKNDKNDSDLSPPRSKPSNTNSVDLKKKQQNNSDSDFSPPRKGREASPRKRKSPPRKERDFPKESTSRCQDNDSDLSPPRKNNSHKGEKRDRARKPSRWGDPDDVYIRTSVSPKKSKAERKSRRDSDSDVSPPRKRQKDKHKSHRKESPHKKRSKRREQSSESDLSPPRKRKSPERKSRKDERNDKRDNKDSKKDRSRKDRRDSYDSDMSPPRKNRRKSESPPRRSKEMQKNRKHRDSDSDLSPPRKKDNTGKDRRKDKRNDDSPPPSNKKMERTLEGKMAGLQNAKQLREENNAFRKREEDAFNMMTDDVSGRNAKAVSRKGKRETSEDRQKQREKAERQKMLDEKYKKWSKGLKQIEAENERIEHYVHEAAKPLARMKDDKDLEHSLKQVERAGDPMLAYIREKKRERGELGPEKPSYKGSFPPNRFNIRPGYRWDGVDRSNGYEKKYFEHQSKRKAQEEEAYKWSTEDL